MESHTMIVKNPDGTTYRVKKPYTPACWEKGIITVVTELLEDIQECGALGRRCLYGFLAMEIQAAETELYFYVEEELPRNAGHYPIHNAKSRRMEADIKKANEMVVDALGHAWFRYAM